jgi:hypothetical protein
MAKSSGEAKPADFMAVARRAVEEAIGEKLNGSPSALLLVPAMILALSTVHGAQKGMHYALESSAGLRLHNVTAEPAMLHGKKGLRVTMSEAAQRQFEAMTAEERDRATKVGDTVEQLAVIEGLEFGNGVIEAEVSGAPRPGAFEGARGFVGIAFRLQNDMRTYDAFYLRPTNGRADDQVRRNHSAQYISHPSWTWFRFRTETPEKYESYVDLVPGEWTKVKIEIRGTQARLYVHDHTQPTLIINDVKTAANAKGSIALWLDVGTEAHFRNLTVTPGAE